MDTPSNPSIPKPFYKYRRVLQRFFIDLILLTILLLGTLTWIITTETGLQILTQQIQLWSPGKLTLQTVQGRLWDRFILTDLHYQHQSFKLQLQHFEFSWEINALWEKRLHIKRLWLDNITLHTTPSPSTKPAPPFQLPNLKLPLQIAVDDFKIQQLTLQPPDTQPLHIDHLELRSITTDKLILQHFHIDSPLLHLQASGQLGFKQPHPLDLKLAWTLQLPKTIQPLQSLPIIGQGQITGNLKQLIITHTISQPLTIKLHSTLQNVLENPDIATTLTWEHLYWPLTDQPKLIHAQQGQLTFQGQPNNYHLQLHTQLTSPHLPSGNWELNARGNQQTLQLNKLGIKLPTGQLSASGHINWHFPDNNRHSNTLPIHTANLQLQAQQINLTPWWPTWPEQLRLNGQLNAQFGNHELTIAQLHLELPQTDTHLQLQAKTDLSHLNSPKIKKLQLNWQQAHWPLFSPQTKSEKITLLSPTQISGKYELSPTTLLISPKGELKLSGHWEDYQLQLNTQLIGQQIPFGEWQISAQGNQHQIKIKKLHSQTLSGQITGHAHLQWHPSLMGKFNLAAQKIHLTPILNTWPSELPIDSQLEAVLEKGELQIPYWLVQLPHTRLQLQGKTTLSAHPQFAATLNWEQLYWPLFEQAKTQLQPRAQLDVKSLPHKSQSGKETQQSPHLQSALVYSPQGQLQLIGNLDDYHLNLNTQITTPHLPNSLQSLLLSGHGNQQQFQLDSLATDLLQGSLNATGYIQWQPVVTAQLQLQTNDLFLQEIWADWPTPLRLNGQLLANWHDEQLTLTQLKLDIPQTQTHLSLHGESQFIEKIPKFDLSCSWQNAQWPLQGESQLHSQQGKFNLTGTLENYRVELTMLLAGKEMPKSHWDGQGLGNLHHFQLTKLQGQLLNGQVALTGQVDWQPEVNWDLKLTGQQLDPGQQWSEWPGQLAIDLQTQGQKQLDKLKFSLQIKQLDGKLRNYPLQLQTQFSVENEHYQVKQFTFRSGQAQLRLEGDVGRKNSQLTWQLEVPKLSMILPNSQGQLYGEGKVLGTLKTPYVTANLRGSSLSFKEFALSEVQANMGLGLRETDEVRLDIEARGVQSGTRMIEKIMIQGHGQTNAHVLQLQMLSGTEQLSVQLQGGMVPFQQWSGRLQQGELKTGQWGIWKLNQEVILSLSAVKVNVPLVCLESVQSKSQMCLELGWSRWSTQRAQFKLLAFPLSLLTGLLPEEYETEITGELTGNLLAIVDPKGTLQGNLEVQISPGQVRTYWEGMLKELNYRESELRVQVDQGGVSGSLAILLAAGNSVQGTVRLPNLTRFPAAKDQVVHGELQVAFGELGAFASWLPQIEQLRGRLQGQLQVGGMLGAPALVGELRLEETSLSVPEVGLELHDLNVFIEHEHSHKLRLQAEVSSGPGQLQVLGDVDFSIFPEWRGELKVTGEQFEAVDIPSAWVRISPSLRVQLSAREGVDVQGEVRIPEALITPASSVGNVVKVSEDVVFVDPEQPESFSESEDLKGWPVRSRVDIVLGNRVHFKGAGLKSRLWGKVQASGRPGKPTVGNGELWLEGTYKAYGQDLKIERGRIVFTGGAIENPGLDIRAFRQIGLDRGLEERVAGVVIQGTVAVPELGLYSRPTLDQTNILSYIVLGKPAAQAGSEEGAALLGAALASQLQGENGDLTQEIAQQFGLDEATISTGGSEGFERSQLLIGKYLSPKLYIGYGVGLFDAAMVLRIRYQLAEQLFLETETGEQSGVDLLYHLER